MSLEEKDRIGQYLIPHLDNFVFDELSDAYLEKAGIADIMTGVPVPLKKTELSGISTLTIARNMAFAIGCDPSFQYKENYIAYILRTFDKRFALGLLAEGVEWAQKKDYDYACIQFRASMLVDPDNADAYYCYGRACKDAYELGEEEEFIGRFKAESLEAFEVATMKNPKHKAAFYFLGYAYLNMGLYIKAKLTWDEFMKLSSEEDKEGSHDNGADAAAEELKKEIAERLKQLEHPVEIEKGYNMVLSGKFEEGIAVLEKYKEGSFAQWWPLWYYLGAAYSGLGQDEEAVSHFLQVLNLSPSNVETMKELVNLYKKMGDTEKVHKYEKKLEIVKGNAEKDRQLKEEIKEMEEHPGTVLN